MVRYFLTGNKEFMVSYCNVA